MFQIDNLSKTIQKLETSAIEAQSLAKNVLSVLVSDRSDESFQLFWEKVQLSKVDLDVDDVQVSKKRKCHQDSKVANVNPTIIMKIQRINTNKFTTKLLTE